MKLRPGDSFYYENHKALGFLIKSVISEDDNEIYWEYALRSPHRDDWSKTIVSIQSAPEAYFIEGLQLGRLNHHRGRP